MNSIIDRCSWDKLSDNFHIIKNNELRENLLLHVYEKLMGLAAPFYIQTFFDRLQPVIISNDRDHRLFAERALDFSFMEISNRCFM